MLSPGLLRLHDVLSDGFITDKEPCFIHQEDFEGRELSRIGDFVAGAMQDIEQERFQNIGCITPTLKVKSFKAAEGERVLDVVENEAVLAGFGPAVQTFFDLDRKSVV